MTALERLQQAEHLLSAWLVDNTEQVFEEQAQIDDARSFLIEAMAQLKEA